MMGCLASSGVEDDQNVVTPVQYLCLCIVPCTHPAYCPCGVHASPCLLFARMLQVYLHACCVEVANTHGKVSETHVAQVQAAVPKLQQLLHDTPALWCSLIVIPSAAIIAVAWKAKVHCTGSKVQQLGTRMARDELDSIARQV